MNQSAVMDTTYEWESIVNFADRHNARCRFEESRNQKKQQKRISKAMYYAAGAAVAALMGVTGLLASWVAVSVGIALACMACFAYGKFVGNREARYGR